MVPALALADVLTGRGHEVAFCGSGRGMERDLVPRAGYPFSVVRIRGFTRRFGLSTLRTLGSIPVAGSMPGASARVAARLRGGSGRLRVGPCRGRSGHAPHPAVAVEMDSHMGWTNRILSHAGGQGLPFLPGPRADRGQVRLHRTTAASGPAGGHARGGLARSRLDPDSRWCSSSVAVWARTRSTRPRLAAFAGDDTAIPVIHVTGEREYPRSPRGLAEPGAKPIATRRSRSWTISPWLWRLPTRWLPGREARSPSCWPGECRPFWCPIPWPQAIIRQRTPQWSPRGRGRVWSPTGDLDPERLAREVAILLEPETSIRRMKRSSPRPGPSRCGYPHRRRHSRIALPDRTVDTMNDLVIHDTGTVPMPARLKSLHFIGIGGAGMSGIALVSTTAATG